MKKSTRLIPVLLAVLAMVLLLWNGCEKKEKETPPPTGPSESDYQASGTVTSETSGTIQTETGARLVVPTGAVPLTTAGDTGTMVFSIERNTDLTVTAPQGETVASDVYRFGPDGFVFASPIEVTIPIPGTDDPGEVTLYRVNPTTGEYESFGVGYDSETRTISAQTYELSSWFATTSSASQTAWGCIHVNNLTGKWLYLCVEQYSFTYPELDSTYTDLNCLWAPSGTIGWASEGNWYVPQGTYGICVQVQKSNVNRSCAADSCYERGFRDNVVVSAPWRWNSPQCTGLSVSSVVDPVTGRCGCNPIPTPSVGTGDVQVTLTWHSAESIDLDLWVTDPDSEICAYWNTTTASGGSLDRDNKCSNYINGQPENIFWSSAPAGEYIVQVDWYSECGNQITSMGYNVRVYANGDARTYTGTITTDQTLEVARFTVHGPTVIFGPQVNRPVPRGVRPMKG
ncbi:MAG: hypothetical protein V1784_10015 [bacterium]